MKFFMHSEQAVALRIWFKQIFLSENAQSFRVSVFYGKIGDKNFRLVEKGEKSCLCFFETVKKSYIVPPHDNKDQIRNRCPHFWEKPRVGMASGFLTIKIQSARFSKIRKFVPLIIFDCEPIFHVIRVLNFLCRSKNGARYFWKKAFVDSTYVT